MTQEEILERAKYFKSLTPAELVIEKALLQMRLTKLLEERGISEAAQEEYSKIASKRVAEALKSTNHGE